MVLDAIGIVVCDLARAIHFYSLLGLDFGEVDPNEDHVEATLPSGLRIMLDSEKLVKSFKPDWVQPQGQRIGLCFHCDSPAGVDAKFAEITGAGYEAKLAPWDAFWGQRYAQVADPDGNCVDLFAPLA